MNTKNESIKSIEFAIDILTDFCECAPEEVTEVYLNNIDKLKQIIESKILNKKEK
jgi:hypothetical protein